MGDDKVIFSFKNHLGRPSHLDKAVCVLRMKQAIDHCGGHHKKNHGGHESFEAFSFG